MIVSQLWDSEDIKDIQEGSEGSGGEGPSSMLGAATASQESVTTLKNPNNSAQGTPRKAGDEDVGGENSQDDVIKGDAGGNEASSTPTKDLTDINANPHLVSL